MQPSSLDPPASGFLNLPTELRSKVYDLIIYTQDVVISSNHPQKDLTSIRQSNESLKNHKVSYRLKGRVVDFFPREHDKARFSLLTVCRQINQDTIPYFYSRTTPHFNCITHINKFLNIVSPFAKKNLKSVAIRCAGYGEPRLTKDCKWKTMSDKKWVSVCERMHKELPSLRSLQLDLTIATWPTQMRADAAWARPFMTLKGTGLDKVHIYLQHARFSERRLIMTARAMENEMMTPAGINRREMEEAFEAVHELDFEAACNTPLPAPEYVKCLKITDVAPRKRKPGRLYKTKGLEKYERINLSTYNIVFCKSDGTLR